MRQEAQRSISALSAASRATRVPMRLRAGNLYHPPKAIPAVRRHIPLSRRRHIAVRSCSQNGRPPHLHNCLRHHPAALLHCGRRADRVARNAADELHDLLLKIAGQAAPPRRIPQRQSLCYVSAYGTGPTLRGDRRRAAGWERCFDGLERPRHSRPGEQGAALVGGLVMFEHD